MNTVTTLAAGPHYSPTGESTINNSVYCLPLRTTDTRGTILINSGSLGCYSSTSIGLPPAELRGLAADIIAMADFIESNHPTPNVDDQTQP